jgi:DNA-binding CsgD family transcriptional regulator
VCLYPTEARLRADQIALERVRKNGPDPHTVAVTRGFGKNRSYLRKELVSNGEWKRSWLYQEFLRPQGVEDRLVCAYAAAPNAESYLVLDREPSVRHFGRRERDLMAFFLQAGRVFHLELLQSYGLLQASRPLSLRERDVLRLLLTGETEKEIAQGLGLTPATLHQYVVVVLRKFGAHSRTDLMAQWLRRLAPPVSVPPY